MPPVVAVVGGLLSAGAAVVAGLSATTWLAVASVALAGASVLMAKKVPTSAGTNPGDRKQVIRSAASSMVGIMGTVQISGVLTFAEDRKNSDPDSGEGDELHLVIAIAGTTRPEGTPVIKNVNKVLMDDKEIPLGESHSGNVYVKVYDGSQTTIDDLETGLTSLNSWRNDMIGKGICFAHVRLRFDPELFPSGIPNFVFELDTLGKTEPPENEEPQQIPSLTSDTVLLYLQHHFGAEDDEIDFESFEIARPICAEMVETGDGGEEHRYTANGAFNFDEPHKQIIDKLRLTAAGNLTYMFGKFGFQVGVYNGPPDFTLNEDDIINDVSVKPQPDRRSLVNTAKGVHVWPENKFQEVDFPEIQSAAMLADDGEELGKDLDFEFCHSPYQCQRLAANDLARARLPVITVPCNWRAFECHLGRNIYLNLPSIGFSNKECVVDGWEFDPEKGVTLTLREDSPNVWTDIVGRVPVLPPDVALPDPSLVAPVTNIQMVEVEVDNVWEARITWQHPSPGSIYEYEVLLEKQLNIDQWVEKLNITQKNPYITIINPESGSYRVTIVAVNRFDVKSLPAVSILASYVPEVTLVELVATVDNSIYPATALVIADVLGAEAFPHESVIYETETRTTGTDWLAAGRGTAASSRLSSLNAGVHQVRMRAIPPYGHSSAWLQTEFEIFAADQPTELTFTADLTHDRWGYITWSGAGQSWEVVINHHELIKVDQSAWSTTTTERNCWLEWLPTGNYLIQVRGRAGALQSNWSSIQVSIADLLPPDNLSFVPDVTGTTGGQVQWRVTDARMEMGEIELLNDQHDIIHTAMTGSPQAIIPVLAPGNYQAQVRARWRDHLSTWAQLAIVKTDDLLPPTDLQFTNTGETAWLGELTWNAHGLPSELVLINTVTTEAQLSITLLSGYYHVSLLPVGNYRFDVRTIGTWSKSDWISTSLTVGRPVAPASLTYTETPNNAASAGRLTWQASPSAGVSGYDVEIINASGDSIITTRDPATYFDIGNIANGDFTGRVRAVSLLANEQSDWITVLFTVSALASPVNLEAEETLVESGTGFTSQIVLKWQANDPRTQSYDAEFRLASGIDWSGLYSGPSNNASRNGLTAGDYHFRVRARSGAITSGFVETSMTVRGMETAPDDITGFQISGITGQLAQLSWDKITSVDVINGGSIHVRHTPVIGETAIWAAADPITERLPGNTTLVTVPLLTGTYLVKAVNPADYWSVNAAAAVSNMGSLVGYNRVMYREEPNHWPGEKNKAVVDDGGSLTLSEDSSNPEPPFYIMVEPLDLGAVFTVRLHLERDGTVYEKDTVDERTNPMDNWEMFDGAVAGGTSLQFQVAATDDNPTNSSVQWTPWTQFFVGEFRARAFKLRIVLMNPTSSSAGTISGLRLVADVPDRTETGINLAVGTEGRTIRYQVPFLAKAVVAVNAQGMNTGDYYRITDNLPVGFTIRFYNNAGAGIARTFDFAAVSYGEG